MKTAMSGVLLMFSMAVQMAQAAEWCSMEWFAGTYVAQAPKQGAVCSLDLIVNGMTQWKCPGRSPGIATFEAEKISEDTCVIGIKIRAFAYEGDLFVEGHSQLQGLIGTEWETDPWVSTDPHQACDKMGRAKNPYPGDTEFTVATVDRIAFTSDPGSQPIHDPGYVPPIPTDPLMVTAFCIGEYLGHPVLPPGTIHTNYYPVHIVCISPETGLGVPASICWGYGDDTSIEGQYELIAGAYVDEPTEEVPGILIQTGEAQMRINGVVEPGDYPFIAYKEE